MQNHVETTDMYDDVESLSASLNTYDDKTHNKQSQVGLRAGVPHIYLVIVNSFGCNNRPVKLRYHDSPHSDHDFSVVIITILHEQSVLMGQIRPILDFSLNFGLNYTSVKFREV